jgi:hypothetical protein
VCVVSFERQRVAITTQKSAQACCGLRSAGNSADQSASGLVIRVVTGAGANGQQLQCLTLIDEFTKEALDVDVA